MNEFNLETAQANPENLRATFAQEGCFILKNVFAGAELEALQADFNTLYEKYGHTRHLPNNPVQFQELDGLEYMKGWYDHPSLTTISKILFGEDVAFFFKRLLLKDKYYRDNAWVHQDFPYYSGLENKVNYFICITDNDARNGGLWAAPRTHKLGYLGAKNLNAETAIKRFGASCPQLKAGDVLAISFYTWHWSNKMQEPRMRVYLQSVHQPASDGSGTGILLSGQWRTEVFHKDFGPKDLYG